MRIDLPVAPALLPYCRKLLAEGADPDALVQVYRGETMCFIPAPLAVFAALATEEGTDRSIRFRRWREMPRQSGGYCPQAGNQRGRGHD